VVSLAKEDLDLSHLLGVGEFGSPHQLDDARI
jgi:hypothetical protein